MHEKTGIKQNKFILKPRKRGTSGSFSTSRGNLYEFNLNYYVLNVCLCMYTSVSLFFALLKKEGISMNLEKSKTTSGSSIHPIYL